MKNRTLLLLTFLLSTFTLYAQDVEHLMKEKYLDCRDVTYNSTRLIPEHFQKGNTDTLSSILNYWEKKCGVNEPLLRAQILLAIKADTLNEQLYKSIPIAEYLSYYRLKVLHFENALVGENQPVISPAYNYFTMDLARELKGKGVKDSLQLFFVDLYGHDFNNLFLRLQDSSLVNTELQKSYTTTINQFEKLNDVHYSFFTGMWLPRGKNALLGNHPLIGMQFGGKSGRGWMFDFTMEFRFGKSATEYLTVKNGQTYATKHFFGGYIGVDGGREIIKKKSHEVALLAGVGFDGFDALNSNNDNKVAKTIGAFNTNIGVGYRKYFLNRSYVGFDVKYNLVNYQNKGGTDLSGNTITIRLKYGVSRNLLRDKMLLRYDHKRVVSDKKYAEWLSTN